MKINNNCNRVMLVIEYPVINLFFGYMNKNFFEH